MAKPSPAYLQSFADDDDLAAALPGALPDPGTDPAVLQRIIANAAAKKATIAPDPRMAKTLDYLHSQPSPFMQEIIARMHAQKAAEGNPPSIDSTIARLHAQKATASQLPGTVAPDFQASMDADRKAALDAGLSAQDDQASAELNEERKRAIDQKLAEEVASHSERFGRTARDPGQANFDRLDKKAERKQIEETGLTSGQQTRHDFGIRPFPETPEDVGSKAEPTSPEAGGEKFDTVGYLHSHNLDGTPIGTFAKGSAGGGAAGGGGGGSGGSGSMGLSMSSTTPGEGDSGGDFDAPYNAAQQAAQSIAGAKGDIATAEGQAADQRMLASDKAMADLQRANDRYNEIADKHYARLEQLNKEVAEGHVDPDHWWHSQGTGQQILYALAAAIGGFASGFRPGTPNAGLSMIKSGIDDDIDAQKANLEGKRHAAEGERGLLAEAYQRTHNMQDAVMLAKQAAYDHVDNTLKKMTAGANSQIANANGALLSAEWDKWRQEEKEKADEFHQAQATKEMLALMRRAKGGGGSGASDKLVRQYGEDLDKRNIPAFEEAINRAEADLAANGSAGLGRVTNFFANHLGDWFVSNKGLNTRADLASAEGEAAKSMGRFGGASLNFARDLSQSRDPAKVKLALHAWRSKINAEKAAVAARYPGGVKEAYEARGGATSPGGNDAPDIPEGEGVETPK